MKDLVFIIVLFISAFTSFFALMYVLKFIDYIINKNQKK